MEENLRFQRANICRGGQDGRNEERESDTAVNLRFYCSFTAFQSNFLIQVCAIWFFCESKARLCD